MAKYRSLLPLVLLESMALSSRSPDFCPALPDPIIGQLLPVSPGRVTWEGWAVRLLMGVCVCVTTTCAMSEQGLSTVTAHSHIHRRVRLGFYLRTLREVQSPGSEVGGMQWMK